MVLSPFDEEPEANVPEEALKQCATELVIVTWRLADCMNTFFEDYVTTHAFDRMEKKKLLTCLENMTTEAYTRYVLEGHCSLDFTELEWTEEPFLSPEQHRQLLDRAMRAAEAVHSGLLRYASLAGRAVRGEDLYVGETADRQRVAAGTQQCVSDMQNVMRELRRLLGSVVSTAVRGEGAIFSDEFQTPSGRFFTVKCQHCELNIMCDVGAKSVHARPRMCALCSAVPGFRI